MEEAINDLLNNHLYHHILLICVCVAAMLFAMFVDLVFGIRKARALGIATTSTGYKKTCEKARKYFTPFAELMCIDLIASVTIPMPIFSMLWSVYCIFCEFKSVREKSWTKAELRKAEKTMRIIIENKDEIAKTLAQLMMSSDKDTNNDNCYDNIGINESTN